MQIALMNLSITNLSPKQLRRAADLKERIDALQDELSELLGESGLGGETSTGRSFSATTRARMRAAQRARWAKVRGTSPARSISRNGRRKVSAAGRARLSALAKERWKKAKAQGKSRL
jgi:hypothetical protein